MPSKSPAQRRFMAAAAHNPAFAAAAGIPVPVAQEFNQADQARKPATPQGPKQMQMAARMLRSK